MNTPDGEGRQVRFGRPIELARARRVVSLRSISRSRLSPLTTLGELLVSIKREFTKLGPLIDLGVFRWSQGVENRLPVTLSERKVVDLVRNAFDHAGLLEGEEPRGR